MVRDDEIKRLISYAKGMGVSVKLRPFVRGSGTMAEWALDGSEIIIYYRKKDSKTTTILSLIHELGHHRDWIANGRTTALNEEQCYPETDDPGRFVSPDPAIRLTILKSEIRGTKYWEQIYNDTNCKFPKYKLLMAMDYDVWVYRFEYRHGKSPEEKHIKAKKRQIKKKYRVLEAAHKAMRNHKVAINQLKIL